MMTSISSRLFLQLGTLSIKRLCNIVLFSLLDTLFLFRAVFIAGRNLLIKINSLSLLCDCIIR